MKKTFLTCMAILVLFAIAGSAGAITCTIDQRPAATLLVPRFGVSLNLDSTIKRGTPDSFDTLIAIGNASSAPMIAHVSVFNARSTLVLDFNVALTGFDVVTWRMSDVISGLIPSTPVSRSHAPPDFNLDPLQDACQRNDTGGTVGGKTYPPAAVYPAANGYLRVRPLNPTTPDDNVLATAAYPIPAFDPAGSFAKQVIDSLDDTPDALGCLDGSVDGITVGAANGYVTIDHANYCNLSNPSDPLYYLRDAMGNENNLFGDIIFISGQGIGTYGMAAVAIESDTEFGQANNTDALRTRTFYARYWTPSLETVCTNCGAPCNAVPPTPNFLNCNAPWDEGFGDQREPLGLKWAVRYFTNPNVISLIDVWRGSSGARVDLTGPIGSSSSAHPGEPLCTIVEPTVQLNFFDEDENGVSQIGPGPCPSPCSTPPPPTFNFPLETNRRAVTDFTLPSPIGTVNAGWVSMSFLNATTGTVLDQAFADYEFDGGAAFISAHWPGFQLDPSACQPLGISPNLINAVIPDIPGGVTAGTVAPTCATPLDPLCVSVGIGP
jgi:hypothetical protein